MAKGIFRVVQLLLDRAAAKRMQDEAQRALNAGTDPEKAKKNLDRIEAKLDSLKQSAIKLGASLAAAFVFVKLKNFTEDVIRSAADAQKIWANLGNTVESAGVNFRKVRPDLEKAAAAFQDATTIDDEGFATILQTLIRLTGNYAVSLRNVGLVANVAARYFDGQLGPAAEAVGHILAGQTRELKQFGIVTNDANKGIQELAQRSMGAMEERAGTLAGKTEQLTGQWQNFKEALGEALIAGAKGGSTLDQLTGSVKDLTKWIGEHKSDIAALAELIINIGKAGVWTAQVLAKSVGGYSTFFTWLRNKISPAPPTTQDFRNAGLTPEELAKTLAPGSTGGLNWNKPGGARESEQQRAAREAAAKKAAEDRATLITREVQRKKDRETIEGLASTALPRATKTLQNLLGKGTGGLIGDSQGKELERQTDLIRTHLADIEDAAQGAAAGISGAFQDSFSILLQGFDNVGGAAKTLGEGITGALLGGVAQYASGKVKENLALSFEEIAKGMAAAANPFLAATAPGHYVAAAKFAGVAGLWATLAGGSGAAQGAIAGGGRGGLSGGVPSGATDAGGRIASAAQGGTLIINIDGVDPDNPRHQQLVYDTNQQATERFGVVLVNGRRTG